MKDVKAQIHVAKDCKPRCFKPRPVPYALRANVEAELDRLQNHVIKPVRFTVWAASMAPLLTVNCMASVEAYPLPRVEDLLASIGKGKVHLFSKLDLANVYQQLELGEDSKRYVTINTDFGLFKYHRLPFGVATVPAMFQWTMESPLRDISNVCVYIDDVLVSGEMEMEHLTVLEEVLSSLQEGRFRLKLLKCAFMFSLVEYLGHNLSGGS